MSIAYPTSTSQAAADITFLSDPLKGLAAIEAFTLADVRDFCLTLIRSGEVVRPQSNADLASRLNSVFGQKARRSAMMVWDFESKTKTDGVLDGVIQARNLAYAIEDAADKAFSAKRVRRALKAARVAGEIVMAKSYGESVWMVKADEAEVEAEPEVPTRVLMVMSALKSRGADSTFDAEDVNTLLRAFGAGDHQI